MSPRLEMLLRHRDHGGEKTIIFGVSKNPVKMVYSVGKVVHQLQKADKEGYLIVNIAGDDELLVEKFRAEVMRQKANPGLLPAGLEKINLAEELKRRTVKVKGKIRIFRR